MNTSNLQNANSISIEHDSDIGLNPFSRIDDYDYEEPILVDLLIDMSEAEECLSDMLGERYSAVSGALRVLWNQHGRSLDVQTVAVEFSRNTNSFVSNIGHDLSPFARDGQIFNRENSVVLNSKFTVFKIAKLKHQQRFQWAVAMQLINQILSSWYHAGSRSTQKILLLNYPPSQHMDRGSDGTNGFIPQAFRTARRNQVSIGLVTDPLSYTETSLGKTFLENSAHRFFQKQKPSEFAAAAAGGALSTASTELLKSVAVVPDQYVEAYLDSDYEESGVETGIVRLPVDLYKQSVYVADASSEQMHAD